MNAIQFNNVRADIQNYIDNGLMFGVNIEVAHKGEIVLRESFGTTDGTQKMELDNLFLAMLVSKSFTAVLTLKAIENGLFTLDTRIAEICPEFTQHGKENITVFHILTHQAGMFGMPVLPELAPTDVPDIDKVFARLCQLPADFPAGTKTSYSSFAGYSVLGKILEKIDKKGRKFAQIAQEELFSPLKMNQSRFGGAISDPKRVAVSHTEAEKAKGGAAVGSVAMIEQFLNFQATDNAQTPGANAFVTIDDLLVFAENMRLNLKGEGTRILSPAMMQYATQNHCGDMDNEVLKAECQKLNIASLKAHFGLHGGYVRGTGHLLNVCGYLASPTAFGGMGGGSTFYMIDPVREVSVAFLSAGFIEGLAHLQRVSKTNDLILSSL